MTDTRASLRTRLGWTDRYRWVDPNHTRTREEYPYSYDAFWLWGGREGSTDTVYSDRMLQWDWEKYERVRKQHGDLRHMGKSTASAFLSDYFGRKVVCTGLAEECHKGNGYPIWIFWYRPEAKP